MKTLILLGLAAAAGTEERLPYRQDDLGVGALLIKSGVLIVVLLAFTYGLLWLARKQGWLGQAGASESDGRRIEVVASRRLTPHTRLLVVEFEGRRTTITESTRHVTMADHRPGAEQDKEGRHDAD